MLMRKATVSFVAPSAIVRMTWTKESEGKLLVKSYGRQGKAVSLPKRSRAS